MEDELKSLLQEVQTELSTITTDTIVLGIKEVMKNCDIDIARDMARDAADIVKILEHK
ncbi:hypothetical protein [Companilactobacillus hulinensis]|uniref:hypothetical protein n=1 Tax=Companilactobacillus hulinensis TaxID=2486007 RepID=UPI0013DDD541|nr:hypothetical protein [Companilactobacillus hulinensis]